MRSLNVLGAGVLVWASVASAADYTLMDLGPVMPATLDATGEVVGQLRTAPGGAVFVDPAGHPTPVGFLPVTVDPGGCAPCQQMSAGHGVAKSMVVGAATTGHNGFEQHAFVWTPTQGMVDLAPGQPFGLASAAQAVNQVGTITGYGGRLDGTTQATVWIGTQQSDLPTLGGTWAMANAMNDAGEIVGEAALADGRVHAVRWPITGGVQDIDTVNGSTSFATVITSLGGIGGEVTVPGVGRRGFVWTAATGMLLLDPLPGDTVSTVKGYNAASQIVGMSLSFDAASVSTVEQAVLWQGGSPQRLDALVALPAGWELIDARGINDAGMITGLASVGAQGKAQLEGELHGFVLQPTLGLTFAQLVTGDFNGDGVDDQAGVTTDQGIWRKLGGAGWVQLPGWATQIVAGDFNQDGVDDLVVLGGGGTIWAMLNGASWQQVPGVLSTLLVGDFTGSGQPQLMGVNSQQYIYWSPALGQWYQLPGLLLTLDVVPGGAGQPDGVQGMAWNGTIWRARSLGAWQQVLSGTVAQR